MGLHWYPQSSSGWCSESHCEGCWSWNHQQIDETEQIPCKLRPLDWLAGTAYWRARPGPWLAALGAHSLAFGAGKWPLLTHKQGLWSSHLLHKPSCSLHRPFEIQAIPVIKVPTKISVCNRWGSTENFSSCIVIFRNREEQRRIRSWEMKPSGESLCVWSFSWNWFRFQRAI